MPDFLVDTNVLLRRARPSDPQCLTARNAIDAIVREGAQLYITSQNVIEYWNVLTRPIDKNGFGMSPSQADAEITQLENFFPMLPETPAIYGHWRQLVVSLGVSGVQVHDARLVAVMLTHGISNLLTFDTGDFKRFTAITAVHPRDVTVP